MHPHVLGVVQRVSQPFVPGGARLVDDEEGTGQNRRQHRQHDEPLHEAKDLITDPTNASSSSGVPMLRYEKSARATFSLSSISRDSRSSVATSDRMRRSFFGAVITTTLSNRASPPDS